MPADQVLHIPRTKSSCGKTIDVFWAYDRLCVQVETPEWVGNGFYKSIEKSVEWLTKTLWISATVKQRKDEVLKGLSVQEQLTGLAHIVAAPQGKSYYLNNKENGSLRFYAPLYDGHLNCSAEKIKMQKFSITHQILQQLVVLEEQGVVHKDFYPRNLLHYSDPSGKIIVEVNDFDTATKGHSSLSEERKKGINCEDIKTAGYFLGELHDEDQHDGCLEKWSPIESLIRKMRNTPCSAREVLDQFERECIS